jgi:hypothetical protein
MTVYLFFPGNDRRQLIISSPLEDIMGENAVNQSEGQDMNSLRRQLLQQIIGVAGTTIATSSHELIDPALFDRLTFVLSRPASIDEKTLRYLEKKSAGYWHDWNENALNAYDLLSYVTDHLQKVVTLFPLLYQPEDPATFHFLDQAQQALMGALQNLRPRQIRQQAIFHTDIADTYIHQSKINDACHHAIAASTLVLQMKSQTGTRRLLTLRKSLKPWNHTDAVHNLGTHITPLLVMERD